MAEINTINNSPPKKRRPIHDGDRQDQSDNTNQAFCCESCKSNFLLSNNGTETKLSERDFEEWCKNKRKTKRKCKDCRNPGGVNFMGGALVVAALCIIVAIYFRDDIMFNYTREKDIPVKKEITTYADDMLETELFKLEESYSKQIEDTWITFSTGIKSVLREKINQPSAFLMLFDNESAGNTAKCIAEDVSIPAINYLMNKSGRPVYLDGASLNYKSLLDDPGILLKSLNESVRENGSLVLTNLQEVPPEVAKMFHFVCDKYSPLVEKAVTFFTLKVKSIPSQKEQQTVAQQTMNELWSSKLGDNELRPLITRMTSNIVRIYSDSKCSVFT